MEATFVFDGACGFCTRVVQWALDHAKEPFAAVPFQRASPDHFGLTMDQARESVWWIDGNLQLDGHRAIAEMLRACRAPWPALGRALELPLASSVAAAGYRVVSRVRYRLPGAPAAIDGAWDPHSGRA
jgi:predicted DCC family thiol-disulfide oxidoreductase YuxK